MCKLHRYLLVELIMSSASLFVVAQPGKRNVNGKIAFVHRDNNMQKIYVIRALRCKSIVGPGQYRNAVASGRTLPQYPWYDADPTLPRYGTDLVQVQVNVFIKSISRWLTERNQVR